MTAQTIELPEILDAQYAETLYTEILNFCDQGTEKVILLAEKVMQVSTTAVQLLIVSAQGFQKKERQLVLQAPSSEFEQILEKLGLDSLLTVEK